MCAHSPLPSLPPKQSQAKLQGWRDRGKAEWQAASKAVLREAGIERA